jgi:Protein of unknown function (DUF4238)
MKAERKAAQHYVPQFILRNFACNPKGTQVWAFNKKTSKIFQANIRNVASEKGFYDVPIDGEEFSFDPTLTQLESHAAPIIKKIIKEESLENLSLDDEALLGHFFAAQYARTRQPRIIFEDYCKKMEDFANKLTEEYDRPVGYEPLLTDGAKEAAVRSLPSTILKFAPLFLDKTWILLKTAKNYPFCIADNPIALQNSLSDGHGPFGSIGFGVTGIEIYFPLSKLITLFMLCGTTAEKNQKTYAEYKRLESSAPEIAQLILADPSRLERVSEGIQTKKAIKVFHQEVERLNSLQVQYASELVFSSEKDFELAQKLIKVDPKYREGPLLVIG